MFTIQVKIKNPPAAGDNWYIYVSPSFDVGGSSRSQIPMDEAAIFDDLPVSYWQSLGYAPFPLKFVLMVYDKDGSEIYYLNSFSPQWQPYKAVYIPSFGSYYFNFDTEQFEEIVEPGFSEFTIKNYGKV